MAGKKSGLGRGLDAFFPEKTSQEKPKTVRNSRAKTNTVREKTTEIEKKRFCGTGRRIRKVAAIPRNVSGADGINPKKRSAGSKD